jgi:hypothetical protein
MASTTIVTVQLTNLAPAWKDLPEPVDPMLVLAYPAFSTAKMLYGPTVRTTWVPSLKSVMARITIVTVKPMKT